MLYASTMSALTLRRLTDFPMRLQESSPPLTGKSSPGEGPQRTKEIRRGIFRGEATNFHLHVCFHSFVSLQTWHHLANAFFSMTTSERYLLYSYYQSIRRHKLFFPRHEPAEGSSRSAVALDCSLPWRFLGVINLLLNLNLCVGLVPFSHHRSFRKGGTCVRDTG